MWLAEKGQKLSDQATVASVESVAGPCSGLHVAVLYACLYGTDSSYVLFDGPLSLLCDGVRCTMPPGLLIVRENGMASTQWFTMQYDNNYKKCIVIIFRLC